MGWCTDERCNNCKTDVETCCFCNDGSEFKPKSNADRIRAMSDEELAEFLIGFVNTFGEEYEGTLSCLEWLKSEVKE